MFRSISPFQKGCTTTAVQITSKAPGRFCIQPRAYGWGMPSGPETAGGDRKLQHRLATNFGHQRSDKISLEDMHRAGEGLT